MGNSQFQNKAVCVLHSTNPSYKGVVTFEQKSNRTIVSFSFSGLDPHSTHAIHIHEYGDLRQGCKSLGAHYNPDNSTHGSMIYPSKPRHAGDLINNIITNDRGEFFYSYEDRKFTVAEIIGRSVVVHYDRDDLGLGNNAESLKTGNAGGRMMCGVIGISS